MNLVNQVTKKLNEYGITIFNDYKMEKEVEHVYYVESMIIFVNDIDRTIGVTFQVTTKPERSATLALILNQIKKATINIMEPFIFNDKNEFISGEKAYKLIKQTDKVKLLQKYNEERFYTDILEKADCHKC